MAKKMFSFPLELYEHDAVQSLNLIQSALFRRLIEYYWKTGKDLPKTPNALIRLSNADYGTFKRYGRKVMETLEIMMPCFIEARESKKRVRTTFQNNALKMRVKLKIKRQANQTSFVDEDFLHEAIAAVPPPSFSNQFNQGTFDQSARQKAFQAKKDDTGKTFTD